MVVRELDELLDAIVPLLGQLGNLVNVLVASVLILLRCEAMADRVRISHSLILLLRQVAHPGLKTESLEETTALKEFTSLDRRSIGILGLGIGILRCGTRDGGALVILGLRVRVMRVMRVVGAVRVMGAVHATRVVVVVASTMVMTCGVANVQRFVIFTAAECLSLFTSRRNNRGSSASNGWR